jgi:hypothetical protein
MAADDPCAPTPSPPGPPGRPCATCGAQLATDQRSCLECGERRGAARLDPVALARGRGGGPARPLVRRRAPARWPSPSRRVLAAAALLVLGFGIVAGAAQRPRDRVAPAPAARRIVVVRPAAPPATAPAAAPAPRPVRRHRAAPGPAPVSAPATPAPAARKQAPAKARKPAAPAKPAPPAIHHVWVVELTGHTMDEALAAPAATPYLSGTLRPAGALLTRYAAPAAGSLAGLIALISGQHPTADQRAGCPSYVDVDAARTAGCVFAATVQTLPGQLAAAGRTWRGYIEGSDLGPDPAATCRHPVLGEPDPWTAPRPGDPYLTQRDPFVYFHAIVDTPDCGANVAGISRLAPDAADAAGAPNVSLVVPDACHDGRDQPCDVDAPAGLAAADTWLSQQLPPLLGSKAYADDGLVVVTFDAGADPARPVGALVLSSHAKAGSTVATAYTQADLLRTIEDAFSLDPLGAARSPKARPLGTDVWADTKPSR